MNKPKHNHKEAFCLMMYASEDRAITERIWNSRDGVTPFVVFSQGEPPIELRHVDWHNDRYEPHRVPKPGDRIFADMTKEMMEEDHKRTVEECWDDGEYPMNTMYSSKEKALEALMEEWEPGLPVVLVARSVKTHEYTNDQINETLCLIYECLDEAGYALHAPMLKGIIMQLRKSSTVNWEAVAKEYRRLYEAYVGADCKPEEAMTEHGKVAIAETHKMLDKVVMDHTIETNYPTNSELAILRTKAKRNLDKAKAARLVATPSDYTVKQRELAEAQQAWEQANKAEQEGIQRELDKLSPEEQLVACTCGHPIVRHEDHHECGDYYIRRKEICPVEGRCTPNRGMCEASGCPCLALDHESVRSVNLA